MSQSQLLDLQKRRHTVWMLWLTVLVDMDALDERMNDGFAGGC